MTTTLAFTATLLIAGLAAAPALGQVTINEIRIDQTGTDNDEYFELAGAGATSLNGLTYLVLGDSATDGCGPIEAVVSLNGLSIPADGYFLCVEPTYTLGGSVDLTTAANALNFENTDNVTHLLVSGFTGALNDDLDTNNDGVLDTTPWTAILDSVAVKAVATGGDCVYSTTIAGPDAGQATNPGHAFRCANGNGAWFVGPFDPASGGDTPGSANGAPTITTQPQSQSVCAGGSVTFTVVATGTGTLSYQWRKGGSNVSGANSASFTINGVAAGDAGSYDVLVTGCGVTVTSNAATLTVGGSTSIVTQPASQTVFVGDPVTISVVANGAPPITYQWRKGGVDIGGATASSFSIASTVLGDAGNYDVVVTSGCGVVTSDTAVLTVDPLPTVRINEIRIDEPGADNNEYFELSGTSGESLNGLTYVVIGDGTGDSCGAVEAVVPLAGFSIPADGYFLAVEDTLTLVPLANADVVFTSGSNALNFENTDSVTHLLVRGFTGAAGNDLDTNNDGVLDATPWAGVLDSVSVLKGTTPPEDCTYSATPVGPDGPNAPGHVYRCPNGTGAWSIGPFDFTMGGRDTPGAANPGPIIVTQPTSQAACVGSTVTFSVVAAGGGSTLTYQWRKNGVDISGATADSLTISPVGAGDAADYDVVVSNGCASVASAVATLSLGGSTTFTLQPQNVHAFVGASASFTVAVTGAPPITYQWRKGGVDIGGATSDTFTIPSVVLGDAGVYDVIATSGCGSTTSDPATLTVKTPPMITINEIRTDQPGSDNDEFFELCGAAGTSLTGLTYVVIGDGSTTNTGVIEEAVDLTGNSVPANGHFLCTEDTFTLQCGRTADLVLAGGNPGTLNLENSDNVTHLVVSGFTGAVGQDLDPDDNCTLDSTPWSAILDQVSLIGSDAPPTGDCTYAPTTVGPDVNVNGSFLPGHVYRCPDCNGSWRIGSFTTTCASNETPGFGNPPCILTPPASQSVCEGQSVTFVVVADGAPPITYQWRRNGTSLMGATSDSFTIPFVVVANAGGYDVVVTDAGGSVISAIAILTVGALFDVRAGNVNSIGGPITNVLFVNNAVGSTPDRRLVVGQNDPFQIRIASPPSRAHSPYAMYAWRNEPTKTTRETLPLGIGQIASHTPFSHVAPQPLKIANNTGHRIAGVENWPGPPTQPSPYVLINLPSGLHRVGTFYLQGIIVDNDAPNGQAGVTNGIVVVSQ